jgi:YVTN family beta-propeller protein
MLPFDLIADSEGGKRMKVLWKAAGAAVLLIAATVIETGCGDVYRPIATPSPVHTGNPSGAETEVVLNCCLNPKSSNSISGVPSSVLTNIDVAGDTNAGNKVLANIVGGVNGPLPGVFGMPLAFDYQRTTVFAADTAADAVTAALISTSTAGFSATTTTIGLPTGSEPIGLSFEYYGPTYTQDYVINSGLNTAACPGKGSIGAIAQASAELTATVCVGVNPQIAWIYHDLSKVFVMDSTENQLYVVSASKYRVTNKIAVGQNPIKITQSPNGQYLYVLNGGDGTISVVDAVNEVTVGAPISVPANTGSTALPIDMAMDPNYADTIANSQYDHIWVLQADGTVSVFDDTTPSSLNYVTALSTITKTQLTNGVYPTNLALMRDGTYAYVGLGNTAQVVAINTSLLAEGGTVTTGATSTVTISVPAAASFTKSAMTDSSDTTFYVDEATTPVVTYIAVSRSGSSADESKLYANYTTSTTYSYYLDAAGHQPTTSRPAVPDATPSWCSDSGNTTTCANLYSGTAVIAAAANGTTTVNSFITTILAPNQVSYCTYPTGEVDGQKNCPLMTPQVILGRS